jgi:hypothetical protein
MYEFDRDTTIAPTGDGRFRAALDLFADAFPPAMYRTQGPMRWVPTLTLTVHVRGRPRPGWLRCEFATRFLKSGLLEEDGLIWDEAGDLVALSRQLALVMASERGVP